MPIEIPDDESQFMLLPCKSCRGAAGYQQQKAGEATLHRCKCGGCGQRTAWYTVKHEAQQVWNGRYGERK